MKKLLLFSTLLVLNFAITHKANCAPAHKKPITINQADGTSISILLHGDEWLHWISTTDNYRIVKNDEGIFEYASIIQNNIEPSGIKASNPDQRKSNEMAYITTIGKHLGITADKLKNAKPQSAKYSLKNTTNDKGFPSTGNNKYLVILANFNDRTPQIAQSNFNKYMNEVNYNGTGSFRDFYLENSNNKLDITSTVTVWVTLPNNHDYYADRFGSFSFDAVKAANDAGIDFSEFDNNNDGYVDGIAIIHQGEGQESSGNSNDIWSHSYNIYSALNSESNQPRPTLNDLKFDGVIVNSYTTQPEISRNKMNTIGVICHEFGHALSALDYYDTNYSENGEYEGTGRWDLMASGCYNGNPSGSTPAHMNCFEKEYMGWVEIETLATPGPKTLKPSIDRQQIYRINTSTENEYFLLENKIKTGFDSYLPSEGMLIYHIDENYIASNTGTVNAGAHQGMYPKIAGNASYGINTTQCPFPGAANNTNFTDDSSPNAKAWNGSKTNKPITDIQRDGDNILFTFISAINTVVFTAKTNNIPLVDAEVSFNNKTARTDKNGQARFTAPIGKVLSYTISKEDYEPVTDDITVDGLTNSIEVELEKISTSNGSLKAGNINLYPNPSSDGHFTISLPENMATYKVYNTAGNIVTMGNLTNTISQLSLPNNIAGIYIIQIEMNKELYCRRLIVK